MPPAAVIALAARATIGSCRPTTSRHCRAGLELGFAPGFEYRQIFLVITTSTAPVGAFTRTDRDSQDVGMGLIRLNYRFGGAVVAR